MRMNPKISSITYVKNGERYIKKCLESIMKQTLHDIEIIVVDGGSEDSTVDIISALMKLDDRIQLFCVEGSVGAQFNTALSVAKGEYIAVCEGDDHIAYDKYERLYEIANKNKLDVIRASYNLFFECKDSEYNYLVDISSPALYDLVFENNVENQFFLSTFINGYWNGLYKRDFLISNSIRKNETKGASFQDITFSFLCQLYARRFMFVRGPYHFYRIDNPEASVNSAQCIEKLTREYDLLQIELKERNLWEKYCQMYLVWEMNSYKQFLDKFSQSEKETQIAKIYSHLINQKIPNNFGNLDIYPKTKALINALYIGEREFFEIMTAHDENRCKSFDYFRGTEFESNKELILFGAGHFGSIMYDFLSLKEKKVTIVDNSLKLQELGFRGNKVYAPSFCVKSDAPIVVANVEHANEIELQLLNMGVDEKRIVVCEYEDLFLREIFMKSNMFNRG